MLLFDLAQEQYLQLRQNHTLFWTLLQKQNLAQQVLLFG